MKEHSGLNGLVGMTDQSMNVASSVNMSEAEAPADEDDVGPGHR